MHIVNEILKKSIRQKGGLKMSMKQLKKMLKHEYTSELFLVAAFFVLMYALISPFVGI